MRDFEVVRTGEGESDWEVRPRDPAIWIKDDIGLFLDHWLIERKDGDTVLNGKAEEFEKQLRDLISNARTIKNS